MNFIYFWQKPSILKLAKVLSVISHPVFVLFGLFITLYFLFPQQYLGIVGHKIGHTKMFLILGLYLVFLPLLMIFLMKRAGIIGHLEINDRSERPLPFAFIAVYFAGMGYFIGSKSQIFQSVANVLYIVAVFIMILALVSRFYKISLHLAAMGAISGLLAYYSGVSDLAFWFMLSSFLVSALVAWARLKVEAHTLSQIYSGWVFGFAFFLITTIFLQL